MSERQYQLPLLIDTGALALGEYAVLDINYRLVQVFDTEGDAEAFVAKANGWDIETVRRETRERGRNVGRVSREPHPWLAAASQGVNRGTALPSTITVAVNIAAGRSQRPCSPYS